MASTYLKQLEEDYRSRAQQEKNDLSYYVQNEIYRLRNTYQRTDKLKEDTSAAMLGSAGMALVGALTGGIGLVAGGALMAGATAIRQKNKKDQIESHNDDVSQQIERMKQQEQEELRAIDAKYAAMLAEETARFNASVKAARIKHGGRSSAMPIVDWLCNHFDVLIQKADRRAHYEEILTMFTFKVEQHFVAIQTIVYENNKGNSLIYDFTVNRFQDLPDFEDRIGFAQAVAKLVQFEIMNRYPQDPLAPSRAKPLVKITSDDTVMNLFYTVKNPNYRPAVKL